MNFHSVEIFPRDVNCRKRHHSGSALFYFCGCMGSQSPTSKTLSHFWLLGSNSTSQSKWATLTRWPSKFTHPFLKRQHVCNLFLFHVAVWCCNLYGVLLVEAMASTLPFSTIVVAGHVNSRGFPGNIGQTRLSLRLLWESWSKYCQCRPILGACVMRCPKHWKYWKAW